MPFTPMTFQTLGLRLDRAVAFRPTVKGQFIDAFIKCGAKAITRKETIHGYEFH
jgi:hypothetical protein